MVTFRRRHCAPVLMKFTIEAQGFAQSKLKDLQLTVGQTLNLDIKLQVAGVKTEMIVTTSAPLIEVERTQQANTIEQRQVENLPNSGRNFQSYVYTLPGVSNSNAPRTQLAGRVTGFLSSGFSIGGSNGRNNLITVDGGENEYGSGQARFDVPVEAIQEFQVNRNSFSAEFGFTAGTAINVITKSARTNSTAAPTSSIARKRLRRVTPSTSTTTGKKAFDQQVFPGFTFGGPVVKNKLFFFTNYERQKKRYGSFSQLQHQHTIATQRGAIGAACPNSMLQPTPTCDAFPPICAPR